MEKITSFLQSIMSLVPNDFHIMRGSQIFYLIFLKSSIFANFHNTMFTNAKFWHFLDWQKFLN